MNVPIKITLVAAIALWTLSVAPAWSSTGPEVTTEPPSGGGGCPVFSSYDPNCTMPPPPGGEGIPCVDPRLPCDRTPDEPPIGGGGGDDGLLVETCMMVVERDPDNPGDIQVVGEPNCPLGLEMGRAIESMKEAGCNRVGDRMRFSLTVKPDGTFEHVQRGECIRDGRVIFMIRFDLVASAPRDDPRDTSITIRP
jgi:hypothetical protein